MLIKEKLMFWKKKSIVEIQPFLEFVEECRLKALCFTGHRSQKLPWRFNEKDPRCIEMRNNTKAEIEKAINDGYIYFISGMALGFDMICAEIVLELKKKYSQIQLICAIPCKNQDSPWSDKYKSRYRKLLKQANFIKYISEEYTNSCMLDRNDYMLKNSSRVIALFNGQQGGTKSTILKAEKMGLKTIIIKP